ncbi:dimethylarginine dimethylaminohydrolase family protein [Bacillus suaedaesalsae]|uniref:N-dimethylarginine dimethylaminohydrolase n=1 Tax=Bacillus suaedaesalsae TaxID=2810349 RepID=A0ABS2DJK2_9BACI|nr:arginine deiminase family protein [Bacillus suaedaesalsae]MBM6618669.1 hypothetical protein [Bacillus suaedaesalsae]
MIQSFNIHCRNEYDKLKTVIVCPPLSLSKGKSLYSINGESHKVTIKLDQAMSQHGEFTRILKEQGIEVLYLPSIKQFTEGVFTRDIAYTLGTELFISKMAHPPRTGEEEILIEMLDERGIPHHDLMKDHIEGGDVLIDGSTIYVGISNRTSQQSADHLQKLLPQYEVISLPFSDEFLHLDCLFNIISPTEAILYPGEFGPEKEGLLRERYEIIEVSSEEQKTLGTNVLSIGEKKIISQPMNENVNRQLRNRGYEVILIDFSEIIRAGGAFRCCSLPLWRD